MSGLSVYRGKSVGYGPTGQDTLSDEVYVKILVAFKEMLCLLKGPRLSVFLCVALHESNICLGNGDPASLSSIQEETGYSRHSVINALDDLVERRFITELAERGDIGEKQYRVVAYAWFGNPLAPAPAKDRSTPPAEASNIGGKQQQLYAGASNSGRKGHAAGPGHEISAPISSGRVGAVSAPAEKGARNGAGDVGSRGLARISTASAGKVRREDASADFAKGIPADSGEIAKSRQSGKKSSPSQNLHAVVVDELVPLSAEEKHQQQVHAEVKQILAKAGIFGTPLTSLARTVAPDVADAWSSWIGHAPRNIKNPQGVAVRALMDDRQSRPPERSRPPGPARPTLDELMHTHGTQAHRLWARSNGGCAECGIPAREGKKSPER